jgi:hypothetical protein
MGRVQGGARAAFATPSWGPARMTYILNCDNNKMKKVTSERQAHFLSLAA